MKVTLKTQIDNTLKTLKSIKGLEGMDVLVGVTEDSAMDRENSDEINNAQLVAYHTKGVRRKSMRREMEQTMETGATYNEAMSMYIASHGSPLWHIPPRPIIESAIEAPGNKEAIAEDLRIAAKYMLDGKISEAVTALNIAGEDAMNRIKLWFEDSRNQWPDISDATKKKKGSNKILQDTGKMRDAITYTVDIKEK